MPVMLCHHEYTMTQYGYFGILVAFVCFPSLRKKIKIGEKSYGNSFEHKDSFYYSYDICRPF